MPFVLRTVQPVFVSRGKLTGPDGKPLVQDYELEAVFNGTLCCAIRQLSSLLEAADDLFAGLTKEMTGITERATALQQRVRRVQDRVDAHDPKLVTVPEGDLTAFSALPRDAHFHPTHLREPTKALFLPASRPAAVQRLYAAAARPTLDNDALVQLDRLRKDGARSSTLFLCTPTLGRTRTQRLRRKVVDIDIETRKPASLVELRRWTSTEALGDMTVHPDCTVRIAGRDADDVDADLSFDASEYLGVDSTVRPGDEPADHQLPTTEEQVKAIADRFPPEVVKVDVTGRAFTRMSRYRRSLLHPPTGPGGVAGTVEEEEARRRTRPRRQRSRRRNTIAGTDQKEIEEALHGDKSTAANTLATVDDIILSSSSMINSNPKSSKETTADFKKWAFNSLRRWGRSRFRASSNSNTSTSSNMVSGELHAADPVDDINVYETVAGKRRGAGTIPISAGISGPMSLAVKLREGSLGQRRLKINDEPPHSSSGNWSASSESGRASVNSDSSHHPKSSTCSSILPHRRRFINNSTSSSVTSEGTLTPEDMAAAPFVDDGETSSVYSCDTEGYYTSFHMDSGLKTLKEEEVGSGLSLPPTPLHSTSALSNCSSGRGSASLAQLTAESEYELFGKGSTSTTASSAGTVCTTLLVDNSRGGDNSLGSDRSLSKGPAVPERKSSLNVPCMAQECPPCSTVVALIHNTSQGHSPRSVSGDSPDSGHNTSSSPIESMSSPQDAETDALISPIPSLTSEMEFSECSDFEGMDRIERIRVKTTINTSRIPSMCAITPPQSDDETSSRQISESSNIQNTADLPRGPAPLPFTAISESNQNVNRNDNYSFNGGIHLTDNNANKHSVDNNFNARSSIALTNSSGRSIIQCDKNSGYATIQTLDNACKENNINQKVRPPSPSGGTLFINTKAVEEESSFHQPFIKDALIPFTSMLSKFRKATSAGHNKSSSKTTDSSKEDSLDESGEYVTITDVKNNNKPGPTSLCTPQRSEMAEPVRESNINKTWESLEYVALNEIATNHSDLFSSDVLSGSSNESSLERQKRRGARVTLDSEGKVVYSSDSLRRRKGAHSTFAPGQHVKDPSVSPSPSPVANHRTPKAIIRPVQQQTPVKIDDSWGKSPLKSNIRSSMSGTLNTTNAQKSESVVPATRNKLNGSNPKTIERSPASATNPKEAVSETQKSALPSQLLDPSNQRNRVIIRAGISSPTREVTKSLSPMRSMSPRSIAVPRGAYVQMPPDHSSVKTHSSYLQTDFDGPEDPVKSPEGIFPPKLFRDSLHHTHHPVPRSSEQVAAAHPVYQNFSGLQRDQPPTNQLTASHNQQRLQGAETSPYRFSSEGTNMGQPIEGPLHSSTPTKPISSLAAPLAVGDTFSPIEKDASQSSKRFPFSDSKFASIGKDEKQSTYESSKQERTPVRESFKSSLVSLPKSTMTSEELYAKIHKSKKQMNIKTDPEIVLSPTPSVCGSQSPVSSERSASPNEPKGGARSRHSWSPNSSKYLDIVSSFDPRSNTPSPNQQVPKEHGLTQITSTHDFKRLLLQHGSGSTIKSKLSAVERLKQAKQAATNVFTNNSAKLRFGSNSTAESTSTSVARLANHPQPPPSKAPTSQPSLLKPGLKYAWRFSGHKNDVRSSPIMEDQREYENIPVAPVPDVLQIQTLSSSPMPARNVGRSFTRTGPRSQTSLGKTSSLPMNSESNPNTRVQQVQNHTAVTHSKAMLNTKQHSIGSRPTLPPTVEGFGTSNSGKGSPTALETAL